MPVASPLRPLAVCADDFGTSAAASAGILRLARAGRLAAVSCRVNGATWLADAPALRSLPANVGIGLHFNLTDGRPLSARLASLWPRLPALPYLALRAHLGLLPRGALRNEFHAQLRAFHDATGRFPAHVDSHHGVHALPILRTLVLDAAEHMRPVPAVRSTGTLPGPGFALRRHLIRWAGGHALALELTQREFAHNPALFGIDAPAAGDYRALVQGWLARVPPQGALLVCRPAESAGDSEGAGASTRAAAPEPARSRQLAYLESAAFSDDLAQAGVALGSVWRMRSRAA